MVRILLIVLLFWGLLPEGLAKTKVRSRAKRSATSAGATTQLPTEDFVEFNELDPLPSKLISWGADHMKYIYLVENELPYVYFIGTLKEGYDLMINDQWVNTTRNQFKFRAPIELKPAIFTFRIFDKERKFQTYRLINYWLRLPSKVSFTVQEGEQVIERGKGTFTHFEHSAFVQLYSLNNAVTHVDLDSQIHAELTFRVYAPPRPEEVYDGWSLIIRKKNGPVVARVDRYGFPPSFIDWREVSSKIHDAGIFTYQMNLYNEGKKYEGPTNEFQTFEGLSLVSHDYLPKFRVEPRGELGYFTFSNEQGLEYEHQYIGVDLAAVFGDRFLVRGQQLSSLHTLSPQVGFGFTRASMGLRFNGQGNSDILGHPYMFQIDILGGIAIHTVSPDSPVKRFTLFSAMIESEFVLWAYHYIVPWAEVGIRPGQLRVSGGLQYQFYIRPWHMKLGIGPVYEELLQYTLGPTVRFKLIRFGTTLTFFL